MKYVYSCITFKNHQVAKGYKETRKYKKVLDIANALNIDNIVVDVCTSYMRSKKNLENILSTPENIVIIPDITALGKNDEIEQVYQRIINSKNELLVCYFDKVGVLKSEPMSTVSLSFDKVKSTEEAATLQMADYFSSADYKKCSTRFFDPKIIEGYWKVERGEASQKEVLEEIGTSRNTFNRRIADYVGTESWIVRYNEELEKYNLVKTPTRLGDISEEAKELYKFFKDNPFDLAEIETRGYAYTVFFLAGILVENWEYANSVPEGKLKDFLLMECEVQAKHWFRQYLRYDKYLKHEQYRK